MPKPNPDGCFTAICWSTFKAQEMLQNPSALCYRLWAGQQTLKSTASVAVSGQVWCRSLRSTATSVPPFVLARKKTSSAPSSCLVKSFTKSPKLQHSLLMIRCRFPCAARTRELYLQERGGGGGGRTQASPLPALSSLSTLADRSSDASLTTPVSNSTPLNAVPGAYAPPAPRFWP